MSSEILIGFRAYTRTDEREISLQLSDAREFFPDSFLTVALCGKAPSPRLKKIADEVIYYSLTPTGLTKPLELLLERAKDGGYSKCILTDGDRQHKLSEICRVWGGSKEKVLVPVRKNRSLFFKDGSDIDRLTLEELENAFLRIKTGCMLRDPQPGLVMFKNRSAISAVNLSGTPSMIGDIVITTQVFLRGIEIEEPEIEIRQQEDTLVGVNLEFRKVFQLESYYRLDFCNVLKRAREDPTALLPRGNAGALDSIEAKYFQLKSEERTKNAS